MWREERRQIKKPEVESAVVPCGGDPAAPCDHDEVQRHGAGVDARVQQYLLYYWKKIYMDCELEGFIKSVYQSIKQYSDAKPQLRSNWTLQ